MENGTIQVVVTRLDDGTAPLELRPAETPEGLVVEPVTVRLGGTLADVKISASASGSFSVVLEGKTEGKLLGRSHPIRAPPAFPCVPLRFDLVGRNATQVVAVSAPENRTSLPTVLSGKVTPRWRRSTFNYARETLPTVSKEGLVRAAADGWFTPLFRPATTPFVKDEITTAHLSK